MKTLPALALVSIALAGCQTTGDPRLGGFFGWSEAKARARVAEQEQTLAQAERDTAREEVHMRDLRAKEAALSSEIARADAQQRLRLERLQRQYLATLQRARALEDDAFTSATASRARRLRARVEATAIDGRLTPEERIDRLRALDRELDAERLHPGRKGA